MKATFNRKYTNKSVTLVHFETFEYNCTSFVKKLNNAGCVYPEIRHNTV